MFRNQQYLLLVFFVRFVMELTFEEILLERKTKAQYIQFFESNQDKLHVLFNHAIDLTNPLAWRFVWVLTIFQNGIFTLSKEQLGEVVQLIPKVNKQGYIRELIKLVVNTESITPFESQLFDICVELWSCLSNASSTRYVAYRLMLRIAQNFPGLKNEVNCLSDAIYFESLSEGIKKSCKNLLKCL